MAISEQVIKVNNLSPLTLFIFKPVLHEDLRSTLDDLCSTVVLAIKKLL